MEVEELLKTIRRIDILNKGISRQQRAGVKQSMLKGRGLAFDSVRKYEAGDDIRTINWNVTARFRDVYSNTFTEDKEQAVWILIDVSSSTVFGTQRCSKLDLEKEIAASLIYNAVKKNDTVGVVFFNEKVVKFIKPAKGMSSFGYIIKELAEIESTGNATDLTAGLKFLMNVALKSSVIFILSDFLCDGYGTYCKSLAFKHELIAIRVYDEMDLALPRMGWVKLRDAESKKSEWVNTSSARFRRTSQEGFSAFETYFKNTFNRYSNDALSISTSEDFAERIMKFMSSH